MIPGSGLISRRLPGEPEGGCAIRGTGELLIRGQLHQSPPHLVQVKDFGRTDLIDPIALAVYLMVQGIRDLVGHARPEQDPRSRRPALIRVLIVTGPIVPAAVGKLDAMAVLTGSLLPAPTWR